MSLTPRPRLRCLVTGGNGFIGSHLVPLLARQGCKVVVLDRTPPPVWQQEMANVRFTQGELLPWLQERPDLMGAEVVFHLAWAHIPESATQHPVGDIQSNLVTTVRLLQACAEQGVRRFVFPSTGGAIYGPVARKPVTEDHPTRPVSAYGVTKLAAEKYIELYHHLHGLEYAILRPSVPYGPGQDPFGRQGAVAVFMGSILTSRPITIWGNGDDIVRDFFHVSDLARACWLAATGDSPAGAYNIGGGQAVSLNHLVALIAEAVGDSHAIRINYEPPRPFDVSWLVLDTSLAKSALGWRPQTPLPAGLAETWAWYRDVWYQAMVAEQAQALRPGALL